MVRKRAGWLAALFLGEMLTATAMAFFEHEIARAVVLALFVPLIISSGGNSGSQASTLVIRAMALGEVKLRDWWRVIRRELAAGLGGRPRVRFLRAAEGDAAGEALRQHRGAEGEEALDLAEVDEHAVGAREPPGQAHHAPRRRAVDVTAGGQGDPDGGLL